MSQALYRKYRSLKLDDVLGQDHVTSILKTALNKGRVAHAYLLSGPRGTGKTSVARILAHQINDLPYGHESNHIDIIEIDAASNNGVDHIRDLREKSRIAPVSAKYKVYIIDEVHMLSKSAFNALLKTLEEPPSHIVFIMATTDANKLPATILSRVQQYHFHPITSQIMSKHLVQIAKKEGFELTKPAADMIAERSSGGFRDSISLLDQLSSLADKDTPLDENAVSNSLGIPSHELTDNIISAYKSQDIASVTTALRQAEESGVSVEALTDELLRASRAKLVKDHSLVSLMSRLIEVPGHSHPHIKLLTTLLPQTQPAVQPKGLPASKPLIVAEQNKISAPTPAPKEATKKPAPTVETNPAVQDIQPDATLQASNKISDFDWQKLTDHIRSHSIGLYSLLAKCANEVEQGKIVIYSGTAFTKKKIEDIKNMQIITAAVQHLYGEGISVELKSGTKPPKDNKLAAVADIMGGGEEVSLEEIS